MSKHTHQQQLDRLARIANAAIKEAEAMSDEQSHVKAVSLGRQALRLLDSLAESKAPSEPEVKKAPAKHSLKNTSVVLD